MRFGLKQPNFYLHLSLAILFSFVLISNVFAKEDDFALDIAKNKLDGLSSEETSQIVSHLAPLTQNIDEDIENLQLALELEKNGQFLDKPLVLQTQTTPAVTVSTNPSTYTVQSGDTISSIGYKFNLKIASLKYVNNLQNDNITPGQILKIPTSDIPTSQIAAAEKAKQKKTQTAAKKNTRQLTSRETSSAGFDGESYGVIVPINHRGISRGVSRGHTGIDFRADIGTAVVAAASGRVIEVSRGWSGGYGLEIVIDHGAGRISRYAHLSGFAVSSGQVVGQGQLIGYSGNTGWSTGPHLHFEWRINGRPTNPF